MSCACDTVFTNLRPPSTPAQLSKGQRIKVSSKGRTIMLRRTTRACLPMSLEHHTLTQTKQTFMHPERCVGGIPIVKKHKYRVPNRSKKAIPSRH
eukprot:6180652-Pleurochrysis_carterae.AAC.1